METTEQLDSSGLLRCEHSLNVQLKPNAFTYLLKIRNSLLSNEILWHLSRLIRQGHVRIFGNQHACSLLVSVLHGVHQWGCTRSFVLSIQLQIFANRLTHYESYFF